MRESFCAKKEPKHASIEQQRKYEGRKPVVEGHSSGQSVSKARGPGRGREGRGRGHIKDTITVTIRALERQKEPSVTPIFYKLHQNTALSPQRFADSSPVVPPQILKDLELNGDLQ
jgi:hypothetical protein